MQRRGNAGTSPPPRLGGLTHPSILNLLALFSFAQFLLVAVFLLRSSPRCNCNCQDRVMYARGRPQSGRSLDLKSVAALTRRGEGDHVIRDQQLNAAARDIIKESSQEEIDNEQQVAAVDEGDHQQLYPESGPGEPMKIPAAFTILTTTNTAFSDLTENWLESLRRLGVHYNITLVAEEAGAYDHFMARKTKLESSGMTITIKHTDQNSSIPDALGFHSKDYIELVGKRPHYILDILRSGVAVLFADADAVWLKDPLPLLATNYENYDVWVAPAEMVDIPCPCFLFLRPTLRAIAMVKAWVKLIKEQLAMPKPEDDQMCLASVMHDHIKFRQLRVRKLDPTLFPTGQSMFLTRGWYSVHKDDIYVVHANKVGGHPKKKFVFKWKHFWYLEEDGENVEPAHVNETN